MQLAASIPNAEALILTHRVDFREVVRPQPSQNFMAVGLRPEVQRVVTAMASMWLGYYGGDGSDVSLTQMVVEVMKRKDWTLLDVINFYKFVREHAANQEFKTYGKPTLHDFCRQLGLYEREKAVHREVHHSMPEPQEPIIPDMSPEQVKEMAARIISKAEAMRPDIEQKERERRLKPLRDKLEGKSKKEEGKKDV